LVAGPNAFRTTGRTSIRITQQCISAEPFPGLGSFWLTTVPADRDQACVCAMLLQHSKFDRRSLPKFANLPGWFVTYGTFLRAFPDVLSGYCVAA
jgi:hypothetical protein